MIFCKRAEIKLRNSTEGIINFPYKKVRPSIEKKECVKLAKSLDKYSNISKYYRKERNILKKVLSPKGKESRVAMLEQLGNSLDYFRIKQDEESYNILKDIISNIKDKIKEESKSNPYRLGKSKLLEIVEEIDKKITPDLTRTESLTIE